MKNLTGGKAEVVIYHSQTLAKRPQQWDAVNSGVADMIEAIHNWNAGLFILDGIIPPGLIEGAPSSVKNSQALWAAYDQFPEVRKNYETVKLLYFHSGVGDIIYSKTPVRTMEDLKGKKWVVEPGAASVVMEKMGGTPVDIPFPEVYSAIEKGVVNGIIVGVGGAAQKFYEVAPNLTLAPDFGAITFYVAMNLNTWNNLPDDVKAVFNDPNNQLSGIAASAAMGEFNTNNHDGDLKIATDNGADIYQLPPDEMALWAEIMKDAPEDFATQMEAEGKPIVRKVMEFVKEYVESK